MARPLDTRLDRAETRKMAAAVERRSDALRRRHIWRAEAAMGTVIRDALARADVYAAGATRLCLADKAAAALAALPDTPELQRSDDADAASINACDRRATDAFAPQILELSRRLAKNPSDFPNASFAELFAWSLAQPEAE